jgi:hypothetical protein
MMRYIAWLKFSLAKKRTTRYTVKKMPWPVASLVCLGCISLSTPSRVELSDEVSTGSGSDPVSIHTTVEFARTITRSLPLSVLTA